MKVAFVAMPFGSLRAAIGVSLLQAQLDELGVESKIHYLNMRFASIVGARDYKYVADQAPSQSLAGDWVFSAALFGERPAADAAYRQAFVERFSGAYAIDRALATLTRARRCAEPFLDTCLDEVDWSAYDVVGFTSTFTQHAASLALARRIKRRHPDVLIAFGGANCEEEMGLQLHRSFDFVDLVCTGEADVTFPRLVEALAAGDRDVSVPGLVSRRAGRSHVESLTPAQVVDLDTLPYPSYRDYFEQLAAVPGTGARSESVLIESSRGCWWGERHHCTFCGLNGTSMAYRSKSADRVLREIEDQTSRYGARQVEMVDNILDQHYFRDLLPALERRQLGISIFYETKATLKKHQVQLLRDAGVRTIQPGIESLSTGVLQLMRKGTNAAQNVQLLKWCKELGITAYWNLLYGFPGEDPDAYPATARILDALHHLAPPQGVGAIRLDRFSPNFTDAAELGLTDVRPDRSYHGIYDLPDAELEHLAYYFEHGYADGRDPESYTADVHDAVTRWHEDSAGRGLVYADHGETLAIWDFRGNAVRTLTILEGPARAAYLYCDQHRSLDEVEAMLGEHDPTGSGALDLLEPLIRDRLLLELDGRFLSLACRIAQQQADAPLPAPRRVRVPVRPA